jgi:hypothetical protein
MATTTNWNPAGQVNDVVAQAANLANFSFLGVNGSVTMKGIWVRAQGMDSEDGFTLTIPLANGSNNPVRFSDVSGFDSSAFNSGANSIIGAIVDISGPIYFDDNNSSIANLKTGYATKFPPIQKGTYAFGRVSKATFSDAMSIVSGIYAVFSGGTLVLGPSESHIGEVGTNEIAIEVTLTVTAASYSAGNCVGGLITIPNAVRIAGESGMLQSVTVNSKSNQTSQFDAVMFNSNPTTSTITDKTNIAVSAADYNKSFGAAHVTDWTNLGTPSLGQAQNLAMPYVPPSGTTIYAALVARGTPTFASTTDISVTFRMLRN